MLKLPMPRVKDVDTVAPDDLTDVASAKAVPSPSESIKKESKKKVTPPSEKNQFRQKIYDILGHTKHPFSSFLVRPKVFTFEEVDSNEEIILVLRQHWFTNVGWILTAIFMSVVPIFLVYVPLLNNFSPSYRFAALVFWYLLTFIVAFEKFLSWYFNVFIITDERVIDIDFNNLLDKKFSEAKISMIQDVTSKVVGLSQTLFNYGSVYIQTASEVPEIEFERVGSPEKIIKVLQQLRQEEEQEAIEGRIR